MHTEVIKIGPLGPYDNNAYIIADHGTRQAIFVDAPIGSNAAIEAAKPYAVQRIVLTHRHGDHWAEIDAVKTALAAPANCHDADRAPYAKKVDATVSNLSVDGVRLVVTEPVAEGQAVVLTVTPQGEAPIAIKGTAVWAQPRDGKSVVGVAFDKLGDAARTVLSKLTQWQVRKDGERTRVVLRGDFTEATRFDELLPAMVGRVVFDMAQVTYMNSLGVHAWCEFLRQARIQGYEFHACSIPFVLQASMVRDVVGRGTVTSFFAPFHCIGCDHQEERLLQSAAILASNLQPPVFKCPNCGGALEFDDLPERFFAFLQDDTD